MPETDQIACFTMRTYFLCLPSNISTMINAIKCWESGHALFFTYGSGYGKIWGYGSGKAK